jgi:hypothetical protein
MRHVQDPSDEAAAASLALSSSLPSFANKSSTWFSKCMSRTETSPTMSSTRRSSLSASARSWCFLLHGEPIVSYPLSCSPSDQRSTHSDCWYLRYTSGTAAASASAVPAAALVHDGAIAGA